MIIFSNLHCEKGEPSTQLPECNVINQGKISNEPFSKKAFLNVIKKLKNNKALVLTQFVTK